MGSSRSRWLVALLAAVALVGAACGGEGDGTDAQSPGATGEGGFTSDEPFVIGMGISQTGFNAAVSQEFLAGLEMWRDMINNSTGVYEGRSSRGLLGRPVEFNVSDDESNPETALRIYERLMTQDQVELILPPYGSGSTGVMAPIAAREGYAVLGASAASESIYQQGLENMVMLIPAISTWLGGVPSIAEDQDIQTASVVTLDNPATIDSATRLISGLEDAGIEVLSEQEFEIGNTDFTGILTNVQEEDPDLTAVLAFGVDGVTAFTQAAELDLAPEMWATMSAHWRNDVFVEGVGKETAECVIGEALWSPSFPYEGNEAFTAAYEEKFGDWGSGPSGSDASAAWGFAAGQVIVAGVDELGEAAVEDQQQLVDFVKQGGVDETVLGPLDVDPETGINLAPPPALMQIQGGGRVVVWPEEVAQGPVQLPCEPR